MTTVNKRIPAGAAVLRDDITEAIRDALMQELASVGYGRLSIEAVARRAGVGKTAVYRRWRSKLEMVVDIVGSVAGNSLPLLDTGSLRGDLEMLLLITSKALRHRLASQIIPDLLAEAARTPEIGKTLQDVLRTNQRDLGEQLVARALERGELPGPVDPDLAMDLIVGPLYWRLAIARSPMTDAHRRTMAAAAAAALEATAAADAPATATAPATPAAPAPPAASQSSRAPQPV